MSDININQISKNIFLYNFNLFNLDTYKNKYFLLINNYEFRKISSFAFSRFFYFKANILDDIKSKLCNTSLEIILIQFELFHQFLLQLERILTLYLQKEHIKENKKDKDFYNYVNKLLKDFFIHYKNYINENLLSEEDDRILSNLIKLYKETNILLYDEVDIKKVIFIFINVLERQEYILLELLKSYKEIFTIKDSIINNYKKINKIMLICLKLYIKQIRLKDKNFIKITDFVTELIRLRLNELKIIEYKEKGIDILYYTDFINFLYENAKFDILDYYKKYLNLNNVILIDKTINTKIPKEIINKDYIINVLKDLNEIEKIA